MTDTFDPNISAPIEDINNPHDEPMAPIEDINSSVGAFKPDLRATLLAASDENPDSYAESVNIGLKENLPASIVNARQGQFKKQQTFSDAVLNDLRESGTGLYDWLQEPDNARIAHDDISFLSEFGKSIRDVPAALERGQTNVFINEINYKRVMGTATDEDLKHLEYYESQVGKPLGSQAGGIKGFFANVPAATAEMIPNVAETMVDGLKAGIVTGAAGSVVPGVGTAVGAGFGMLAGMFKKGAELETGASYGEFKSIRGDFGEQLNDETAKMAAVFTGLGSGGFETLSLTKLAKTIPAIGQVKEYFTEKGIKQLLNTKAGRDTLGKVAKRYGESIATEGATEALQEASIMYAGELQKITQDGSFTLTPFDEQVGRIGAAAKVGAQAAIGLGFAGSTYSAGRVIAENSGKPDPAQVADYFRNAGAKVKDSALYKRSPAKFKEQAEAQGGDREIYVNSEKAVELYQSLPPETQKEINEVMPNLYNELQEAALTGKDVPLSQADYLTYIAPNDEAGVLADYTKLDADQLSIGEIDQVNTQTQEVMDALREEYAADQMEYKELLGDSEKLEQRLVTELQNSGKRYSKTATRAMASIHRSLYESQIERYGSSAQQALEKIYGKFRIEGPAQDKAKPRRTMEDGYIDSIRNESVTRRKKAEKDANKPVDLLGKKKAKKEKALPTPLISFLSGGGINSDSPIVSELSAIGVTPKAYPRLFKKNGDIKGLDNLVAQDVEEALGISGIFQADENGYIDPDQLLGLLRDETFGDYLRTAEQSLDEQQREYMDQILEELDKQGIDVETALNQEIKDALAFASEGQEYNQDGLLKTDTEAFKNWFGDSKVVDENGDPLVVYHGTDADIEAFELTKRGSRTDSGMLGKAFYFGSEKTAKNYGKKIIPSYLKIDNPLYIDDFKTINEVAEYLNIDASILTEGGTGIKAKQPFSGVFSDAIKAKGHDGVITKFEFASFKPSQIKSVNNLGTFDPNDDRIFYQDGTKKIDKEFFKDKKIQRWIPKQTIKYPKKLYRGVNENSGEGMASYGQGLYMTGDKFYAKDFGEVIEMGNENLPDNPLYLETRFQLENIRGEIADKIGRKRNDIGFEIDELFKGLGYDGLIIGKGKDAIVVTYDLDGLGQAVEYNQSKDNGDKRGSIQFQEKGDIVLKLTKASDLSTFLHESGHLWLEYWSEFANQDDAPADAKADWAVLKDWLGVKDGEAFTVDQHEQFARGMEAYFMQGKAPSKELKSAFGQFMFWLNKIYQSIKSLNVDMKPEITEVMDRMFATDAQIEDIANRDGFKPDPTVKDILNKAENEIYLKLSQSNIDESKEKLMREAIKQHMRKETKWFKEARDKVVNEETGKVKEDRLYKLINYVTTGKDFEGKAINEGQNPKISRKLFKELYGEENAKAMPRGSLTGDKDGIDPRVVADLFGYNDASVMVEAMMNAVPIKQKIQENADNVMIERYGDMLNDGTIEDRAMESINGPLRALTIAFELEKITLKAGQTVVTKEQIESLAKEILSDKEISKIRPYDYYRAGLKSAREFGRTLSKRQFEDKTITKKDGTTYVQYGAVHWKRKQLLNHYLFVNAREASELKTKTGKLVKTILKASDKKVGNKRDVDFVNAARQVASQFGLAPIDNYLEQLSENDKEKFKELNDMVTAVTAYAKPYNSLTLGEARDLHNVLEGFWKTSRSEKQMLIDGEKIERDIVLSELIQDFVSQEGNGDGRGESKAVTDAESRKLSFLGIKASLRRVESWVDLMDKGDVNGIWRKYLFTPVREGIDNYREDKKTYLQKYLDMTKDIEKSLDVRDIKAPEIGYTFKDKAELIHAILHTGNESNKKKLLLGRKNKNNENWGELSEDGDLIDTKWRAMTARMEREGILTKEDYKYVEATFGLMREIKPKIQKAYKAMYGHYFEEVEEGSIQTSYGEIRGGYVPAITDNMMVHDGSLREDKEAVEKNNNTFMFPTTGSGFVKNRQENYNKALALDLRLIPQHIDKVIRFVHIEPRIKDVAKVINNKDFRKTVETVNPSLLSEMFIPWLQRAARQTVEQPMQGYGGRAAGKFFSEIRKRTGMNIMVGNVVNTLQQYTGFSIGAIKSSPTHLKRSLVNYVKNPSGIADDVAEKSIFMNNRVTAQMFEIQNTMNDLLINPSEYEKARAFADKHGYFLQQATQNQVDIIVWMATYEKSIEDSLSEKQAVRASDSAVRLTQGSFAAEDVSKFESGNAFVRGFTMFYSYFNMQANIMGTEFAIVARQDLGFGEAAGKHFYIYLLTFMIPAVLAQAMTELGSGDLLDDDDDDGLLDNFLGLFFGSQFRTATALAPGGNLLNAGVNQFNDKWYDDKISTSPVVSSLEGTVRAPHSVYKALADDGNKKRAVKDSLTAIGMTTGLPVGPLGRPLGYWADIADGNVEPSGPVDFVRGSIVGR